MKDRLIEKISQYEELIKHTHVWDHDHNLNEYHRGLCNGIRIGFSVLTNYSPVYIEPRKYKRNSRIRHKCK